MIERPRVCIYCHEDEPLHRFSCRTLDKGGPTPYVAADGPKPVAAQTSGDIEQCKHGILLVKECQLCNRGEAVAVPTSTEPTLETDALLAELSEHWPSIGYCFSMYDLRCSCGWAGPHSWKHADGKTFKAAWQEHIHTSLTHWTPKLTALLTERQKLVDRANRSEQTSGESSKVLREVGASGGSGADEVPRPPVRPLSVNSGQRISSGDKVYSGAPYPFNQAPMMASETITTVKPSGEAPYHEFDQSFDPPSAEPTLSTEALRHLMDTCHHHPTCKAPKTVPSICDCNLLNNIALARGELAAIRADRQKLLDRIATLEWENAEMRMLLTGKPMAAAAERKPSRSETDSPDTSRVRREGHPGDPLDYLDR